MDLAVHTDPERFAAGPLDEVDAAVAGDMDYFKDFKRTGKLRTARHLFSSPAGYASFYFAYRWAEVLDKDIFEAFERAGGPDRETARKFRKAILERDIRSRPCSSSWISWAENHAWTPCSARGGWPPERRRGEERRSASAEEHGGVNILYICLIKLSLQYAKVTDISQESEHIFALTL